MDLPNLDQLRLRPEDWPKSKSAKVPPPRHRQGELFLKGPVPIRWLTLAMQTSYPGLRVAIVLWYLAGRSKSREVTPTWSVWAQFGFSPDVGRYGLGALERAELVKLKRHRGRCPIVTILDVSE
jgi:hypothetical protein